MSNTYDTSMAPMNRQRRPRVGERTRGAVDALQTKIAVAIQNLDPDRYLEQLQSIVNELPEATGTDSAFVALISDDGLKIDSVLASCDGFAQCSPGVLAGEKLDHWPWLSRRLGHLRVIEVADTLRGPRAAKDELERLNDLHIGAALIIGFAVRDDIAGFLAIVNERPVDGWDANLHLLLKLFGSSLAVGLRARQRQGAAG